MKLRMNPCHYCAFFLGESDEVLNPYESSVFVYGRWSVLAVCLWILAVRASELKAIVFVCEV